MRTFRLVPAIAQRAPELFNGLKRRLAGAACSPNVVVSKPALEHEINADMVFKWRRQYRAGLFGVDAGPAFLPVAVEMEPKGESALVTAQASALEASAGTIEIPTGDAVVRVQGMVDARVCARSSRVCARDGPAGGHTHLDRGRRDRHALRLQRPGGEGGNSAEGRPVPAGRPQGQTGAPRLSGPAIHLSV